MDFNCLSKHFWLSVNEVAKLFKVFVNILCLVEAEMTAIFVINNIYSIRTIDLH